ncbi:unnamed protein product [Phytophthora fragariaefolia]|uniref:Unnamed protein product n=1 Tax=Phytophthora fragariaefolia TaxID=1490495 RepID=A0A9W6Y1Z9_9STRA|nr:unnamed protein product [Phytophthora fragariaefolia]
MSMSKKKTLPPTASLATCLNFAARVLSSSASVQEICTKPVLAPMVVEAHRYGQQVLKHLDPAPSADVRELLRVLQSVQSNHLSALARLEVADLTWDFEGIVADTLEMELEELNDRATTNTADTCVVLSASSHSSTNGQAVIWFPKENYDGSRNEGDKQKPVKGQQILLYICPGRVKVVKSVGDLVKKLYDELPAIRDNGARYNVWAVYIGDSRVGNQHEHDSLPSELSRSKDSVASQVVSAKDLNDTADTATPMPTHMETNKKFTEPTKTNSDDDVPVKSGLSTESSNIIENHTVNDDSLSACSEPQYGAILHREDVQPPLSRSADCQANTKSQAPLGSIFSFGVDKIRSAEVMQSSLLHGSEMDTRGEDSNRETECSENDTDRAESDADCIGDNRIHPPWKITYVSSSVSNFTAENCVDSDNNDVGLGIRLQQGLAWQSCDGKVLRTSVRPQAMMVAPEIVLAECREISGASNQEGPEHSSVSYEPGLAEAVPRISAASQSLDLVTPQGASKEALSCSVLQQQVISLESEDISIFRFGCDSNDIQKENEHTERFSPKMIASAELAISGQHADDGQASKVDKDDTEENNAISGENASPVVIDNIQLPKCPDVPKQTEDHVISTPKPKSARVNYKDKLGARVWWELEYTARKLEREEMLERRGQASRYRSSNHVTNSTGLSRQIVRDTASQRLEPTGWLKRNRPGKQSEVLVPPADSCEKGNGARSNDKDDSFYAEPASTDPIIGAVVSRSTRTVPDFQGEEETRFEQPLAIPLSPSSSLENRNRCTDLYPYSTEVEQENKADVAAEVSTSVKNPDVEHIFHLQAGSNRHLKHSAVQDAPPFVVSLRCPPDHSEDNLDGSRLSMACVTSDSVVAPTARSSFPRSSAPEAVAPNCQYDEEAEAHTIWASAQPSYDRDRTMRFQQIVGDEAPDVTETIAPVPFTVRGRVPIRPHRAPSKVAMRAEAEAPSSASASNTPEPSPGAGRTPSPDEGAQPFSRALADVAPTRQPAAPQPVATFIALAEDAPRRSPAASRHERLDALRQKKLRKLQQARDASAQQHKQKRHQRHIPRPPSLASAAYSKKASNRRLLQNALEFTLLAGGSMARERARALQALARSPCDNFVVLLKSAKELQFRALYESHVERDSATRIFSVLPATSSRAPLELGSSDLVSQFFRYSSAKKQFVPVATRSFTVATDACALTEQLALRGKARSSAIARLL